MSKRLRLCLLLTALAMGAAGAAAADWPMWGGTPSRNMVSSERGLPTSAEVGKAQSEGGPIDLATTKNVKWIAKLGSAAYGNPTVAGGCVFVGTNNAAPRQQKYNGDYGILMCFDEASGKFDWQLAIPKLEAGKNSDWESVGLCCSPTVDGDRVYIVTNRCEVACLGASGRQQDTDIVWRYDMRDELGAFPHNMTSSSPLVVGDKLFVTTSNGVDWTGKHTPAPDAPALICLDKKTGKLLAVERSGISRRTLTSNWSSPAYGIVGGRPMVVFGGGDGFCYGFDANLPSGKNAPAEPQAPDSPPPVPTLKELWRCDCNPPSHKTKDGKPIKYGDSDGPSEIIATPVVYQDRVYVAVGQEPEQGDGVGALTCIDATKSGDITGSGKIWTYDKISRSLSTPSISNDLLFIADFAGMIHCVDLKTGRPLWTQDTESHIWGSTLLADGKIYVGNENGLLTILAATKEKKTIGTIDFRDAVYSTPVAANGILFVATQNNLFAFQQR